MSPAGLLFRDAVWRRLMSQSPGNPRELRAGRGADTEDQPSKTKSASGLRGRLGFLRRKSRLRRMCVSHSYFWTADKAKPF